MFKRFVKFWRSFYKFILSEKKWCWPRQCEVLILDATQPGAVLAEYLKPWNPEVLHMRGERLYILVLLASFFRHGSIVNAYTDCFVEKVSPRLVVTFMDNYLYLYSLSNKHPEIQTLFVQNGLRGYCGDIFETIDDLGSETTSEFFVDYLLVFGSAIGEKYSQFVAGQTVKIGSIKNNLVRKEKSPQRGVIVLVSQWRRDAGLDMAGDLWAKPDGLVVQFLMQYAKTKDKRLMIIPNRLKNSTENLRDMEEDYFRGLLGRDPEFLCPSGPYPAYQAVDSAEVVVALDSTLGLESIARGNKTAIFSIRGHFVGDPSRNFGWPGDFPDKGLFWTNNPDTESFAHIMDYLFEVDDEQWREDVKASDFSSVLAYDPDNVILKKTLERVLGVPPSPWIYS
jgi:surface carbohydrate biosynthesis protein